MTLTQTAILVKRGTIAFIILITLIISGMIGYNIWHQKYLSTLPAQEELPEEKFGKLPELSLPKGLVSSSNFSYSLDTTTGGLPKMPTLIKVYFIPQAGVSLLAPEKSKQLAKSLGFNQQVESSLETTLRFKDNQESALTIDLTTGNFNFERKIATLSAESIKNPLPNQSDLVKEFKSYLEAKNLLPEPLRSDRSKVIYDKTDATDSETAQVNLWPKDFDNLPIITSSFSQSLIKAEVNKSNKEVEKFQNLYYTYWPIDQTTYSTYKIKTAEQAFSDLKSGKGVVVLEPAKPQVSISKVYLGYFQGEIYTSYLQPIFVFEGPHFVALVPAIIPR